MRRHLLAQFTLLAVAPAASMLPAPDARAQGSACDQLKATLAARIDPSIHGFSLDTVSASTPVPAGAKVIGTCEGGAYKILFRRSGGAPLTSGAASVAAPLPAPAASPVVAAPSRAAAPPAPASQAAVRPRPGPSPAPAAELPKPSAAAPETSAVTPPPSPTAVARHADAIVPPVAVATPVAPETPMTSSGDDAAPLTQRALALLGRYWYAFAALAVLALGPPLWAWAAHRRAYDASGLPRGPRIR